MFLIDISFVLPGRACSISFYYFRRLRLTPCWCPGYWRLGGSATRIKTGRSFFVSRSIWICHTFPLLSVKISLFLRPTQLTSGTTGSFVLDLATVSPMMCSFRKYKFLLYVRPIVSIAKKLRLFKFGVI